MYMTRACDKKMTMIERARKVAMRTWMMAVLERVLKERTVEAAQLAKQLAVNRR